MSTLVEDDTRLDELTRVNLEDIFLCRQAECEKPAAWMVMCRTCPASTMFCETHMAQLIAGSRFLRVYCVECRHGARSLEEQFGWHRI